jgi:hypothetical protein
MSFFKRKLPSALCCCALLVFGFHLTSAVAQRKRPVKPKPNIQTQPADELKKLSDQYLNITKEYKASLEKLLGLYQASEQKAAARLAQSQELFTAGLVSKRQLEESEHAVAVEKGKIAEVKQQIANADTQIAQALIEVEGEKQLKSVRIPKGGLIRTTSFIRYNGTGAWSLAQAGKIEVFFQQAFKRPLPIAVFGQGAIHNQWRLDHRNAMDISLAPDDPEGQALINFLQSNGIPFSAFRTAIPGVATGPHIHIGMPSHRY